MEYNLDELEEKFNFKSKSIQELEIISRSGGNRVLNELARYILKQKLNETRTNNQKNSEAIDFIIRQESWYDFEVASYDGFNLTVIGSIDLSYFYTLEIIFKDVFFIHGFLKGWHSDTSKTVFEIPENSIELNEKYEIEFGNQLFIFKTEDYKNDVIIAAESISYKAEKVYYQK